MKQSKSSASSKQRSGPPGPVLGLDLSMTGLGAVVWDGKKVLAHRRLKTEPVAQHDGLKARPRGQLASDRFAGTDEERIEWLRRKVAVLVKKYQPAVVVIEGYAFGARGRGKTILSELNGVVKNMLVRKGIVFIVPGPKTIKKHMTGDGNASKLEMIAVAKKLCRSISDSDRADALGCAKYGYDEYENIFE